jgi:hypothetical protein
MSELKLEKNVISEIEELKKLVIDMKQDINFVVERFEDKFLSEEDKNAIDETLKAEKEGKLKSMEDVFN